MSTWYKAGTVTITNGSANVVGVDTLWASQVSVGDVFTIDGTKLYEIASITDNTEQLPTTCDSDFDACPNERCWRERRCRRT